MSNATQNKKEKTMKKATKKITLRNDFHNTEVNLIVANDYVVTLTKSQMRRLQRTLCGSSECCCGTVRGVQGEDGGLEVNEVFVRSNDPTPVYEITDHRDEIEW